MGINKYAFESGDTDIHMIPMCVICKRKHVKCVITRDGFVCIQCKRDKELKIAELAKLREEEYRLALIKHKLQ